MGTPAETFSLAMAQCVLAFSDAGQILDASASTAAVLGYSPDELRQRAASECLHPRDLAAWQWAQEELRRDVARSRRMRLRWRHAGAGWTSCETELRVIAGGIQARLRAQFDRDQAHLRALIEWLPEAWLIFGADSLSLEYANRAARKLWPRPHAARRGRSLFELLPFGPEAVRRGLDGCRGGRAPLGIVELGGAKYDAELQQVGDGAASAGLLLRLTASQAVAARSADERPQEMGGLGGMLAHDVNNLATVILSYSDQLLAEGPAEIRQAAGEISDAARSAAALCQRVLALSRGEPSQPGVIDLNRVLRKMSTPLRRMLPREIALHIRLGEGPLMVRAEVGQLEQIILNLTLNARDAMPQGGRLDVIAEHIALPPDRPDSGAGRASVARAADGLRMLEAGARSGRSASEPPRAEIGLTAGDYALLTVRDSGQGMDAETRRRIFEPYFTTKGKRGHGLGLTIVQSLAQQVAGTVGLESQPGEGAAFTVYLPLVPIAQTVLA